MKTTKRFFAAAFVALSMSAFNACIEEASPVLPEEQDEKLVEMTIEASQVDVKSTFSGKQIGWELDDKVAVYDGKAKREFSVTAVNDGKATLTGMVAADATDLYAVFPYSAARDVLPSDEGKIYISVPQEQVLAEGKNFDEDAFVTTGKIVDNHVTFKNAVSLLKLHVPSGVTSVSIKGFAGENIVGGTSVSATLKPAGESFTEGDYYIAILPVTFNTGFKVIYEDAAKSDIAIKKNTSKVEFPVNGGQDITAATASITWIPNPLISEDDLLYFVDNQTAYAGEAAKLGQDIALTKQWTPVDLKGTLDGQGYTISGLNVNMNGGLGAMCSVENGAALMNVTVEGTITYAATAKNSPAGLVGNLHGTMYNVTNRTTINASSSADLLYLGGLAGWVHGNGKLIDCVNEGNVILGKTSKFGYVGGIAGVIYSSSGKGLVKGCVNTGTVTSTENTTNGLGGIVGVQESGETVNCVNKGTLQAEVMRYSGTVGGIVGLIYNNTTVVTVVNQCKNDGTIDVNATEFRAVGGIVGGVDVDNKYALMEIADCENKENISIVTANAAGSSGLDGFYLGGILGSFNASNDSEVKNTVRKCINSGNVSLTTSGSNNSAKVGGICGNTRGPVVIEANENAAQTLKLESSSAAKMLCSAGGIIGEVGDPWVGEETIFTLSGNVNRASVLSKTNNVETPAGGLVGYLFGSVTSSDNKNFGNIERSAYDGTSPSVENCFAGGLVGLMSLSSESKLPAYFDADMTIGDVKSVGRAGMLFGGVRSSSYADLKFPDCVVSGRLVSPKSGYDLDITSENYKSNTNLTDGCYLWSYIPAGKCGLNVNTVGYGEAVSNVGTERLSAWQQGYMDIHHISTGRGNCTFMILPDGTTMMVDAGDNGPANDDGTKLDRVPDESLTPAEWIVRYVTHFMDEAGLPVKLDHMLVSHFHYDHVGVGDNNYPWSLDGRYLMTGIAYVGSTLEVDNFVDRAYPDYDFPYTGYFDKGVFRDYVMMDNYLKFLESGYNRVESIAGFEVGSADQFVLKNTPRNDFSIRNIYSNGQIWTGLGESTENLIPADTPQADLDNENLWSAVINISYGNFDYHTGGDILGADLDGTWFANDWRDIETPVAKLIKETDVICCNHHGYDDAMNETFLWYTTPQACIVPAWEVEHPGTYALSRMNTAGSNVFAAGPVTNDSLKSGHVVVRVYEGGSTFRIFVLDDESTDYGIVYQSDIYTSAN